MTFVQWWTNVVQMLYKCFVFAGHPPGSHPANTRRWTIVGLMLGQRRRRWPNIKTTLAQRLEFAGTAITMCCFSVSDGRQHHHGKLCLQFCHVKPEGSICSLKKYKQILPFVLSPDSCLQTVFKRDLIVYYFLIFIPAMLHFLINKKMYAASTKIDGQGGGGGAGACCNHTLVGL